ncbi:hypothetical protein FGO68_gene15203 [Halteria grandinella]|uniref:TRP C-terminal domain-containing protein n=1 Tax=Halteria grandinella TaxID=5974 RepID=A0A8J8T9I8_HALGN|nr:hypothetical protein FGO68_gene15203 [Halteria grandinella]
MQLNETDKAFQLHYLSLKGSDGSVQFQMRIVTDMPAKARSEALYIENQYTFYSLVSLYTSPALQFILVKYQFHNLEVSASDYLDVESYSFTQFSALYFPQFGGSFMQSGENIYFLAGSKSFNSLIFSGITYQTAQIMTLDPKQTCLSISKNVQSRLMQTFDSATASNLFTIWSGVTLVDVPHEFTENSSVTVTDVTLNQTLIDMKQLCQPSNQIYMSPIQLPSQEHIMESQVLFSLKSTFFTGYFACDDGKPSYAVTQSNGAALPLFLQFAADETSISSEYVLSQKVGQLTPSHQGTYFIKITATFNQGSLAITTFSIKLVRCFLADIKMFAVGGTTTFSYDITSNPSPLVLSFYSTNSLPQCTYSYFIDDDWANQVIGVPDTDIFTYEPDNARVTVATRDASKVKTYLLSIGAKQDLAFDTAPFNVPPTYTPLKYTINLISSPCSVSYTYSGKTAAFEYTLGTQQDMTISLLSTLKYTTTCKGFTLSYQALSEDLVTPIPSFFKFDVSSLSIIVSSSVAYTVAPYQFAIIAEADNYEKTKNDEFKLSITILPAPNLTPPLFTSGLKPGRVTLGEELLLKLPSAKDKEGNKFSMNVDCQNATSFISVNLKSGMLTIKPTQDSEVGSYMILITLTDSGAPPLSSEYAQGLIVVPRYYNTTNGQSSSSNQGSDNANNFTTELEASPSYQKFKQLQFKIQSVTNQGVLSLRISDEWPTMTPSITNRRILQIFESQLENITISSYYLLGSSISDSEASILPHSIKSISGTIIQIQLHFESPDKVSTISSQPDFSILRIFFNPRNTTYDPLDRDSYSSLTYKTVRKALPVQMSSASAQVVNGLSTATSSALYGTLATNFIVQFFLSHVLQLVWFSMNNLQLIVLLPLLNLSFPPNAQQYLQFMATIANFDLLPSDTIFDSIFKDQALTSQQDANEILSANFQVAGYQTSNIIRNIKSFFFYVLVIGLLFIVYQAAHRMSTTSKFAKELADRVRRILFYNPIIRLMIESYVSLSLACFIGIASVNQEVEYLYNKQFFIFNQILSYLLLVTIIVVPIFLFQLIKRNQKLLISDGFMHKYSTIYGNLNFEKRSSLNYICILFLKRFLVTFSLVFLRHDFNIQMLIIMNASFFCLLFYIVCRPFNSEYINRIEIFNECTFLTCSYLSFLFTDIIDDPGIKMQIGWVFIIVIVANLLVNFSGIFIMVFSWGVAMYKRFKRLLGLMDKLEIVEREKTVAIRPTPMPEDESNQVRLESVGEEEESKEGEDISVPEEHRPLSSRSRSNSIAQSQDNLANQEESNPTIDNDITALEGDCTIVSFRDQLTNMDITGGELTPAQAEFKAIKASIVFEQNMITRVSNMAPVDQLEEEKLQSPGKIKQKQKSVEQTFKDIYSKKGQQYKESIMQQITQAKQQKAKQAQPYFERFV